jgi:hypothetical protein
MARALIHVWDGIQFKPVALDVCNVVPHHVKELVCEFL